MNAIAEKLSDIWYEVRTDPTWQFVGLVLMPVLLFVLTLFFQPSKPVDISGYLVSKEYRPSTTSVGVGSGISSDGKPVTVVTTSGESEKWVVVLLVNNEYQSWEVSPNTYYSLPENQNVTLHCQRGAWIRFTECP